MRVKPGTAPERRGGDHATAQRDPVVSGRVNHGIFRVPLSPGAPKRRIFITFFRAGRLLKRQVRRPKAYSTAMQAVDFSVVDQAFSQLAR
jgi:hypothetical protein